MGLSQYSLSNLTNSVAEHLATALLEAGYLLYWNSLDALQTVDGVYPGFFEAQDAILADPAVAAAYADSRGILTLLNADAANPRVLKRPTIEGSVGTVETVPIPSLMLTVAHLPNGQLLGTGSKARERYAAVQLAGFARAHDEHLFLKDLLRVTFDESLFLPLRDHDAGTRATLQLAEVQDPLVFGELATLRPAVQVYEIALTARLQYEA